MQAKKLILCAITFAVCKCAPVSETTTEIDYSISIGIVVSPGLDPQKTIQPLHVVLNQLSSCNGTDGEGCSTSELKLLPGTAENVDINLIECRGYKDFAGIVPGSEAFNVTRPALISTNLGTISSILCYVVPAQAESTS